LFAAAVRLVSERGDTAVPVTALAEAADMSRQAMYLQFADRDAVFVAAGIDLIERELFPRLAQCDGAREMTLLGAEHLARYQVFYRALVTGSCAYSMKQAVIEAVRCWRDESGRPLVPGLDLMGTDVLVTFVTGGMFSLFGQWLVDSDGPADPMRVTEQVLTVAAVLGYRDPDRPADPQ
jgi:AcrR family transcriptional regulator